MSDIQATPVIVKIDEGTITNSVTTMNQAVTNIDLFNSKREDYKNYKLLLNGDKFTVNGSFTPNDKDLTLGDGLSNGTLYLNGDAVNSKLDLVVGTHLGEVSPSNDLLANRHVIKCTNYDANAKLDFVYVQMTTGVPEEYGDPAYRKSSSNTTQTANEIKKMGDLNGVRIGFSHYLTGHPLDNGMTAEAIGKAQAQKFLQAIVGSETSVADSTALNGGMIPIVVFVDNITTPGYYGAAPTGVKKELENF